MKNYFQPQEEITEQEDVTEKVFIYLEGFKKITCVPIKKISSIDFSPTESKNGVIGAELTIRVEGMPDDKSSSFVVFIDGILWATAYACAVKEIISENYK